MAGAEKILIRQARVYDPSQEWEGELRDLYVAEGRISEAFDDPQRVIDAEGRPLLPGGIDPYCPIAAQGQALTRMFAHAPSPDELGRAYASMGYVHVHVPLTNLLTAGVVRQALRRIPFVDTSTCVNVDLRDMGQSIRANQPDEFSRLARALIHLTGAHGLSLPFPYLRHKQRHYIQKNLSAKKVLSFLSLLDDKQVLPINLWGMPGLLENEIPSPDHFHIAGLGLALDSESSVEHATKFLAAGGSADLGLSTGQEQVVLSMDNTVQPASLSLDVGIGTPVCFQNKRLPLGQPRTKAGWSLLRQMTPSHHLALGASGPAGGQFEGMPSVITWLLDPNARPEELNETLKGFTLDLYEWARFTRLEPARSIGLSDVGHLRMGARANLALYDLPQGAAGGETTSALRDCWCLIKDGVLVREASAFTGREPPVEMRRRSVDVDVSGLAQSDLLQNSTLRFEHLDVCPPEEDQPGSL